MHHGTRTCIHQLAACLPLLSQHRANLPATPLQSAPMQGWRKASEMHLYDNEAAPSA